MTKRRTKEQKKAKEIAAIRQRLLDIALGAYGYHSYPEIEEMGVYSIGVEAFGRYIGGIKNAFQNDDDGTLSAYIYAPSSYDRLDNLDSAAEYLWTHGVRA